MAIGQRDLLAFAFPYLQTSFDIQVVNPFVVDDLAGLPELEIDHAGAVGAMALRQSDDLVLQGAVSVFSGLVTVGAGVHADDEQ